MMLHGVCDSTSRGEKRWSVWPFLVKGRIEVASALGSSKVDAREDWTPIDLCRFKGGGEDVAPDIPAEARDMSPSAESSASSRMSCESEGCRDASMASFSSVLSSSSAGGGECGRCRFLVTKASMRVIQ